MKNNVRTLTDAIRYFADEQVCIDTVAMMRWTNGPVCSKCASLADRQHWLKTQRRWQCRDCGKQYSVKVNTIFEDSAIGLDKWLTAMWLLANCKNGISSYEIAKDIGVTQKSAWFMLQRIRRAMKTGTLLKIGGPESGPIEVDESFVGGKVKNMHRGKVRAMYAQTPNGNNKIAVMGMFDRDSRKVRTKIIPNVKRKTLQGEILDNIHHGSTVYTDSASAYQGLKAKYIHETVNHAVEYVNGQVHTNSLENFWALTKRTLAGTYVAVEPFHLDRYLDEQMFRFNNRATKDNPLNDADRFLLAVSQISGKKLTYAELTGKVGESVF